MTGNTFGALKAKLTRHSNEYIKLWQEEEETRKNKEIQKNINRWTVAIAKLKEVDTNFDRWYDSEAIPEVIKWTGKDFEDILSVLRKRLRFVKKENKNEK